MSDLEDAIRSWDGRVSGDIDAIYMRHCNDESFVSNVVKCLQEVKLQKGATWLLKRYLERGQTMKPNHVAKIFAQLSKLESWESRLHVLQCMQYMPIGARERAQVEGFLRKCLIAPNKFERAWAYNGFYEFALQYPEYEEQARSFFNMAMRDEAPSVKARIRNLMRRDFKPGQPR